MKKFRNFAPTLTDLSEFMFVQEKGNQMVCYEVKIDEYDYQDSVMLKGLILEATENRDEVIFTKKIPLEYVELERGSVEGIPLLP